MTDNKLLAEVNGNKIYENDLAELMAGIEDRDRFNSTEGKNILTDELVNQELLLQDAISRGLDKEEEFVSELEKVKNNMLKNYAMHKIFETVEINDSDVDKYYEENKDTIFSPVNYTASHILVDDENQAVKIKAEINDGLDFAEAAKKYSIDPSSDNGGMLGTFPKGVMVEEFQNALDDLKVGEISEPIKSDFGYHIIILHDKKSDNLDYKQIKDQVRNTYEMAQRQEKYLEVIKNLSKNAKVKKYY